MGHGQDRSRRLVLMDGGRVKVLSSSNHGGDHFIERLIAAIEDIK